MSADASNLSRGPDASNRTIGVLISGRGSNLQALIDAVADGQLDARIAIVISNRTSAAGLARAGGAGIETLVVDHRSFPSRDEFDRAVAQELLNRGVRLVCLAGFMRLVGAPLLDAFPNAILNIHPSLLPAFPGVEAQRQALDHEQRKQDDPGRRRQPRISRRPSAAPSGGGRRIANELISKRAGPEVVGTGKEPRDAGRRMRLRGLSHRCRADAKGHRPRRGRSPARGEPEPGPATTR